MTHSTFSLMPFPDLNIPKIQISGKISRQRSAIEIHYNVTGDVASIRFPQAQSTPQRRHDLWTATCFEFFIAIPDQPQYWEYNVSPSGDWNVYRMDAYRRIGFREEPSIQNLSVDVSPQKEHVAVVACADLDPLASAAETIQIGVACVMQTEDGHETYWALTHPNSQADFHLRDSFTLALEA